MSSSAQKRCSQVNRTILNEGKYFLRFVFIDGKNLICFSIIYNCINRMLNFVRAFFFNQ